MPGLGSWLVTANGIAFALMLLDKYRAKRGGGRISEDALLGWAMIGGSIGTFAASRLVRHKTQKQPFATTMMTYFWTQVALLAVWQLGILDWLLARI
ncbi:MAG TPA: DUF1294 domain-containing protein [Sphingopyxis sp.]|nr:DUF1294 domain-containing protein [Sphingopyxis sp.]